MLVSTAEGGVRSVGQAHCKADIAVAVGFSSAGACLLVNQILVCVIENVQVGSLT